jgi:GH24 family phage-related lysozyme (muramidase)
MFPCVRSAFKGFTAKFEGVVQWMYLDVKGLVTTGIGNLIDPVEQSLDIPWQKADETPATRDEIRAEWESVKGQKQLAQAGCNAAKKVTGLRLSDDAVDDLVLQRLDANAAYLAKHLDGFEEFPADAQMAILSMSWALGPGFLPKWPKLSAAIAARDWDAAAENCGISTKGNAGVAPRNDADVALFKNAAAVAREGLDAETLWYPEQVPCADQAA